MLKTGREQAICDRRGDSHSLIYPRYHEKERLTCIVPFSPNFSVVRGGVDVPKSFVSPTELETGRELMTSGL